MKLKKITSQHRNDFRGIVVCEHCGHEAELKSGYNDGYYHEHVIPSMICAECGVNRAGTTEKTSPTVGVQII